MRYNEVIQVQCCVERAIELTLNQLSDTGDDDMLLRDALRDMIEVLVDDQVHLPFHPFFAKPSLTRFVTNFVICGITSHTPQLSLGTRIGYEISRKRPDFEGSVRPPPLPCKTDFRRTGLVYVSNAHAVSQVSVSTPAIERFGVGANKCDFRAFLLQPTPVQVIQELCFSASVVCVRERICYNCLPGISPAEATISTASALPFANTKS
jgi:hypothetical protein